MVNSTRIAEEFTRLAAISSPPLREQEIARYLAERLARLGAEVLFDRAGEATGGEVGNLVARFQGRGRSSEPLLLSVHMDTVEPCQNVQPRLADGIFTSSGETILGADDKAGITEIIEALEVVRERNLPHGPIEIVVTIAEEIGLVGAKHLDFSLLKARRGFALDTPGIGWIVLRAPGANRLKIEVTGREAHAGVAPEQGLSAVQVAARAVAAMRLGRIDTETTANIGLISGGQAVNIVPRTVRLEGEARSHDPDKLIRQTDHMVHCFDTAVRETEKEIDGLPVRAKLAFDIQPDYPRMAVAENSPLVQLAFQAAENLGQTMQVRLGGGGSDANIFNAHGIETAILGTGMEHVHSFEEQVAVADMAHVAKLLVEIISLA